MYVTVDSQKFDIQFVHSSPDLKKSTGTYNPGGVRQVVDMLAMSFNRRVSAAFVSTVEPVPSPDQPDTIVGEQITPIGMGFTQCYHSDNFNKHEGRGIALLRALTNARFTDGSKLTLAQKDAICGAAQFASFGYLKATYSYDGRRRREETRELRKAETASYYRRQGEATRRAARQTENVGVRHPFTGSVVMLPRGIAELLTSGEISRKVNSGSPLIDTLLREGSRYGSENFPTSGCVCGNPGCGEFPTPDDLLATTKKLSAKGAAMRENYLRERDIEGQDKASS